MISRPQNEMLRSQNEASDESTELCVTRAFFLPLFPRNFDDQLSSNFPRFVICAYIEIHHVRKLLFENNQRCPVSLGYKRKLFGRISEVRIFL